MADAIITIPPITKPASKLLVKEILRLNIRQREPKLFLVEAGQL